MPESLFPGRFMHFSSALAGTWLVMIGNVDVYLTNEVRHCHVNKFQEWGIIEAHVNIQDGQGDMVHDVCTAHSMTWVKAVFLAVPEVIWEMCCLLELDLRRLRVGARLGIKEGIDNCNRVGILRRAQVGYCMYNGIIIPQRQGGSWQRLPSGIRIYARVTWDSLMKRYGRWWNHKYDGPHSK